MGPANGCGLLCGTGFSAGATTSVIFSSSSSDFDLTETLSKDASKFEFDKSSDIFAAVSTLAGRSLFVVKSW